MVRDPMTDSVAYVASVASFESDMQSVQNGDRKMLTLRPRGFSVTCFGSLKHARQKR
jgi:hypothetical protein